MRVLDGIEEQAKSIACMHSSTRSGPAFFCLSAAVHHLPESRMDIKTYRRLHAQAARLSRSTADAEDLVQETLLAALQAGRAD
ncbi:MAG: sigma factor, partial [Pseudoxanthomonas sp.]